MGEGEGEEQQKQRGDDTQEAIHVSRCPQEDCSGATRSMGKGKSRKENRLAAREQAVFYMPGLD